MLRTMCIPRIGQCPYFPASGMQIIGRQGEGWIRPTGPTHPSFHLTRISTQMHVCGRIHFRPACPQQGKTGGISHRPGRLQMPRNWTMLGQEGISSYMITAKTRNALMAHSLLNAALVPGSLQGLLT